MKLKQLVAAGLMIPIASFAHAAASDSEFVVKDIRVEGLQRVALGAALTYIPVQVGDKMNEFRTSQLIRDRNGCPAPSRSTISQSTWASSWRIVA